MHLLLMIELSRETRPVTLWSYHCSWLFCGHPTPTCCFGYNTISAIFLHVLLPLAYYSNSKSPRHYALDAASGTLRIPAGSSSADCRL
nr:hypothetical protein CFP56_76365 [Quercus suber]